MAARLTVIISQAAARSSTATDLEEALVAELLFQAGLDANLVGPLEQIQPESTDHLCISGFNHNLALITWLEAEQVQAHFDRLGLDGTVRPLDGMGAPQEDTAATKRRSIFHLRLETGSRVPLILEQLKRLLQDRQTPTFSIMPLAPIIPARQASAAQATNSPTPKTSTAASQQTSDTSPPRDDEELTQEQWSQLDQLVDDFEALDF